MHIYLSFIYLNGLKHWKKTWYYIKLPGSNKIQEYIDGLGGKKSQFRDAMVAITHQNYHCFDDSFGRGKNYRTRVADVLSIQHKNLTRAIGLWSIYLKWLGFYSGQVFFYVGWMRGTMLTCEQCSSLKCAHAFECEGFQNNHMSLKLSNFFATLYKKILDIGRFVLNMEIIWCLTILKKYMQ